MLNRTYTGHSVQLRRRVFIVLDVFGHKLDPYLPTDIHTAVITYSPSGVETVFLVGAVNC